MALKFQVSRSTLSRRLASTPARAVMVSPMLRLTPNDEESLLAWIISLDECGTPPQPVLVRQMVNVLLVNRIGDPLASRSQNSLSNTLSLNICGNKTIKEQNVKIERFFFGLYDWKRPLYNIALYQTIT